MIELLIREMDPSDKNGRYSRENFRRIKQYLDDGAAGKTTIQPVVITSPAPFNTVDPFDVTIPNQTTFVLSAVPQNPTTTSMTVNGVAQTNGSHFVVSGVNVTFDPIAAGFQLETVNEFGQPDKVVFQHMT